MRRLRRVAIGVLFLVLIFIAAEAGRLYVAYTAVQDAARTGVRYASTGSIERPLDFEVAPYDGVVGCVEGDERGVKSTHVTADETIYEIYAGGAESLFATWYDGDNCTPSYRVHQNLIWDMLRLVSITNAAREALGEPTVEVNSEDDLRAFLYSLWEQDVDVIVCSSRDMRYVASRTWANEEDGRFVILPAEAEQRPVCLFNEIVPFEDAVSNAGLRWADAGAPGDTVTVIVSVSHRFLLGGSVRLRAEMSGVVERFTSASAQRGTATPTKTPTPMRTPTPTRRSTFTPTPAGGAEQETETAGTSSAIFQTATALAELFDNLTQTAASERTATPMTDVPTLMTELPDTGGGGGGTPGPQVIEPETTLQVRRAADGEVIGNGTISLYAPDAITGAQSARVELELSVDELYLTPTPAAATAFPVTRITSTPRSRNALGTPIPTPTPRNIIHEVSGSLLYQRMGASLLCPPGSFVGCDDDERSWQDAKRVMPSTTRFTWLLRAQPGVLGTQEMTIELWHPIYNREDGTIDFVTLNDPIAFTMDIRPADTAQVTTTARLNILFVGALAAMSIGGIVLTSVRLAQGRTFSGEQTKPKVFISYRRRPSWVTARAVANALEARGADVFLDVDDINEGRFADVLEQAIAECDYFLVVLAPTTLESKWVRREIKRAMEQDKVIIPLVTDDFSFYGADLPDGLEELSSHNAVKVMPEYFEEAMDRIAVRFINLEDEKNI